MKTEKDWTVVLLQEHERAIKQRDIFLLTGKSTSAHGGSHDTCFGYLVKQIQLDAMKEGMTRAIEIARLRLITLETLGSEEVYRMTVTEFKNRIREMEVIRDSITIDNLNEKLSK